MNTKIENSCIGCGQIFMIEAEGECFDCKEKARLDLIALKESQKASCWSCQGFGTVESDEGDEDECEECNGTGEVESEN